MEVSKELQRFIEENIDLIEQDTKESWEKVYNICGTCPPDGLSDLFIDKLGIDPAERLGYIPTNYLYNSKRKIYVIPDNITSMSWLAFCECKAEIIWGSNSSMTLIDNSAFSNYKGRNIVIPDNITCIGDLAFTSCNLLRNITIPDSVTSIGADAFYGCDKLLSIRIPDNVTIILGSTFCDCKALTNVTIGSGIESIGERAFEGCKSLTSILIPNSVKSIGNYAFCDCKSLISITIPNSVTSIGAWLFGGCNSLIEIHFKGTKKEAITRFDINNQYRFWQGDSPVKRMICTDGVIEL